MTPGSIYDGRIVYSIDNNLLYVQSGSVRVFYYTYASRVTSDSQQTCSSVLANMMLVLCVTAEAGQHVFIPPGKLFIVQALTNATLVVTRYLCGYTMKKQITSYRLFYNERVCVRAVGHD